MLTTSLVGRVGAGNRDVELVRQPRKGPTLIPKLSEPAGIGLAQNALRALRPTCGSALDCLLLVGGVLTCNTPSRIGLAGLRVGVLRRELMTTFAMRLADIAVSSMNYLVGRVRAMSSPAQVRDPVVGLNSVVVARFMPLGRQADMSHEDEAMYEVRPPASALRQRHSQVTATADLQRFGGRAPVSAYTTKAARLVISLKLGDLFPDFVRLAHVEPLTRFGHDPGRLQSVAGFSNPPILLAGADINGCAAA